jgi:hypothetical protein
MCHDKKSSGKTITAVRCDEIGTFRFQEMTNGELRELL